MLDPKAEGCEADLAADGKYSIKRRLCKQHLAADWIFRRRNGGDMKWRFCQQVIVLVPSETVSSFQRQLCNAGCCRPAQRWDCSSAVHRSCLQGSWLLASPSLGALSQSICLYSMSLTLDLCCTQNNVLQSHCHFLCCCCCRACDVLAVWQAAAVVHV